MVLRPKTIAPSDVPTARKILIHGAPGTGKTPLAASFIRRNGTPEKAVYIACDKKESSLSGVLPVDRANLILPDYAGCVDPFSFIKSVLEYDWRADGASNIIIDTGTQMSRDFLTAAINSGSYNAKAVTFGSETFKLGDKPHWGLAHILTNKIVAAVEECPLNVLMLFWADYQEPEDGYGAWGGPLTVNMNESKKVAGKFPNILYTRTATENGRTKYFCHTESFGIWVARLSGVLPNPIPIIEMAADPINVWKQIDKAQCVLPFATPTTPQPQGTP